MEPGAGRWIHVVGKFLRQHRPPRRVDMATCHVSRARSTKRKPDYGTDGSARSAIGLVRPSRGEGGRSVSLGIPVGCLQALRRSWLFGSVSDRVDCADRDWFGPGAERRLQWLRLLRRVVSVWGD